MILEKSVRSYLSELASNRPVPGGGSASCIVAAQAASLVSMACEISRKRGSSRRRKARLKKLEALARTLAALGAGLAEWDVEVFKRLIAIFKKRYASTGRRRQAIQKALRYCTASCLDLAILTRDGMKVTCEAARCVRPDMQSEIHTALYFWEAAFYGAWVNTEANLAWVKEPRVQKLARRWIQKISLEIRRDRRRILKVLRVKEISV